VAKTHLFGLCCVKCNLLEQCHEYGKEVCQVICFQISYFQDAKSYFSDGFYGLISLQSSSARVSELVSAIILSYKHLKEKRITEIIFIGKAGT